MRDMRQEHLGMSALGFVGTVLETKKPVDADAYATLFGDYVEKRKMDPILAHKRVEHAMVALIQRSLGRAARNGPLAGFEWFGGIVVALITGKAALALVPIGSTVYPLRALVNYMKGEKKEKNGVTGDTLLLKMKSAWDKAREYSKTLSPSGDALDHLMRTYQMLGLLVLHRRLPAQGKSTVVVGE
jgi:hypothetical protein